MAAVHHLGFVWDLFGLPSWCLPVAKFGCNQ